MINIDMKPLLKDGASRYSLVVGIAKRSREILDKAKENNEILESKPVSIAVDELMSGKYIIKESKYNRKD